MFYLVNPQTDPAINHALEEYFLKETDLGIISLWQHHKTVLLGRNQDVYSEVDLDFCRSYGINVVRRISGGGTIYCDTNNMQYTFIGNHDNMSTEKLFSKFAKPIVDALQRIHIPAEFTGRNDIVVGDKKVSGNAQYRFKDRILHHGSLLFDVDMDMLKGAIRTREEKYRGRGVASVASRVGRLSTMTNMTIEEFMDYIAKELRSYVGTDRVIHLDKDLLSKISPYINRYNNPSWNLGKRFNDGVQRPVKHSFGLIDYRLGLKDGKIERLNICGDYFSEADRKDLERHLIGCSLDKESLGERLEGFPVSKYILGMDKDQLIIDLMEGSRDYEEKTRLD